jgi:hypothetical protein
MAMIGMSLGGSAVAASSVPYKDSNASGFVGLCDKTKHPITSGSIYDKPFVWTAVSSTPAPKGYEHGKATLIAYQPRKDVDPGQWSGRQLTSSSSFTNPAHPMSQATNGDDPLVFFTGAFPPRWDGLIELRLYFSGPDVAPHQAPYPATNIRVTGERWSVVSSGSAACNAGTATSIETVTLPKSKLASPAPVKVNGVAKGTNGAAGAQPTTRSEAVNVATGLSNHGSSDTGGVTIGLLSVAVLGVGTGGFYLWRRKRSGVES